MKWRRRKRQARDVAVPYAPPGAAFLEARWICGGCDRRLYKRISADQPVITLACPVCDEDNPAAALVTEEVVDG